MKHPSYGCHCNVRICEIGFGVGIYLLIYHEGAVIICNAHIVIYLPVYLAGIPPLEELHEGLCGNFVELVTQNTYIVMPTMWACGMGS